MLHTPLAAQNAWHCASCMQIARDKCRTHRADYRNNDIVSCNPTSTDNFIHFRKQTNFYHTKCSMSNVKTDDADQKIRKDSKVVTYSITSVWHRAHRSLLSISTQVTLVINPEVGWNYFPRGLQFLFQPKRSPPLAGTKLLPHELLC